MIFTAPAILNRISFASDGGLNLGFITQELTAEEKLKAAQYHKQFGYLLFKESAIQDSEIPDKDPEREGEKTPAQRLRAVLFVLWQQTCGHTSIDFDSFYRSQMDKIIESKKRLLEE